MPNERVLFVDDETNILESYRRVLWELESLETALSGEEALSLLESNGPFALVVSDMRMPVMDGVAFLAQVRERYPTTVRMMLTGNADLTTAIDAVNEGHIFRFLTKPCDPETLERVVRAGLEQHRLITAEKELLDQTLSGTVRLLTELLAATDPKAFNRASNARELVRNLAAALDRASASEVELAWMLSHIGRVTIPPDILKRLDRGFPLTKAERRIVGRAPRLGERLLSNIPRMERITRIVGYKRKNFDGSGFPEDDVAETAIPMGARVIRVVDDLIHAMEGGIAMGDAFQRLSERTGVYDPHVLRELKGVMSPKREKSAGAEEESRDVSPRELHVGDRVLEDVYDENGGLLLAGGTVVSEVQVERIANFARLGQFRGTIAIQSREQSRTGSGSTG